MSIITYEDFEKVDLRSGTVIKTEEFFRAKKPAYKVWVDFGPEIGIKKTSAQVRRTIPLKLLWSAKWWAV